MEKKYVNLLNNLRPYIICHEKMREKFEKNSHFFNEKIEWVNPLNLNSIKFVNKVLKLDELSFGGVGMGMSKWVLFDCAMLPSFVFGFTVDSKMLQNSDLAVLNINKGEVFPVSMYIAIPQGHSDSWFGHNLCSLNHKLDFSLDGLGLLTKAFALKFFEISHLWGATQWDSPALNLHLKFSPMRIHSAQTPNHSKENSLCYSSQIDSSFECLNGKRNKSLSNTIKIKRSQFDYKSLHQRIEKGELIKLLHLDHENFYFEKTYKPTD